MRAAAALASRQRKNRPVLVVVSAMSKITDLLLDTMRHAEAGDRAGIDANLATLRSRHEEACRELLSEIRQAVVMAGLHGLIAEFERIEDEHTGPLSHLPPGRFERKAWTRPGEDAALDDGGVISAMRGGRVFEKVGVMTSTRLDGVLSP